MSQPSTEEWFKLRRTVCLEIINHRDVKRIIWRFTTKFFEVGAKIELTKKDLLKRLKIEHLLTI